MQLPPASVRDNWPTPDYVHPETRGHIGTIAGFILCGLATITLAIRLYTRKWLTRGFGLDDVLILVAYFPAIAFTVIGIVGEGSLQWNRHTWDVETEYMIRGLQLTFANQILFDFATCLIKLSILTLLYRLTTATGDGRMTIAVLVSIVLVSLSCFVFVIVAVFQCTPLFEFWEISTKPQNCINQAAHLMAASIINTVTDWLVVLLPMKTALSFNLPTRQSAMIVLLFGAGILASSAGIARTYYTWLLSTQYDTVWNSWTAWFSSAVELNLGIICASIPATKPFFASYLPSIFGSTFRPRSADWDRKRLAQSPSLTTFIDLSSAASSTSLPRQPEPLLPTHQPINLNKPLPPIADDYSHGLEARSLLPDNFSSRPRSLNTPSPRQAIVRVCDRNRGLVPSSLQPRDRTTIFIMYRADSEPGPMQQIPSRASLA
ncbi:integral membrane protein [Hypoxylon sp. NC1633]|nr:integral membrane protein [Hypoxylon sp. NC1633]